MKKISNWLVIAAVTAVGIAAGVSAILNRDEGNASAPPPPTSTESVTDPTAIASHEAAARAEKEAVAGQLRREGALGILYFADKDCHLRAIRLPDLTSAPAPDLTACRFAATSSGRPSPRRLVWEPGGRLVATCDAGGTQVFDPRAGSPSGGVEYALLLGGCAPAWTPAGRLTLIRAGGLEELDERQCAASRWTCTHIVVSRADLDGAFRALPSLRRLRAPSFEDVAWLSEHSFLAVLSAHRPDGSRRELMALFNHGRLVASPRLRRPNLSLLRVSPTGSYAAVQADATGLWILRARGGSLTLARFPPWSPPAPTDVRAITWSPDERWTAVASRTSVYVFRTANARDGFIGLPIRALDLTWGAR